MFKTENTLSRSRRLIDNLLCRLEVGELASYDRISQALGEPFSDACRSAIQTGINWMERERGLTMDCVRGVGYRVVHAREVVNILERRTKRAGKQLHRGLRTGERVDISGLSVEEQAEHQHHVRVLRYLKAEVRRAHRRIDRVEAAVQEHGEKLGGTEAMMSEMLNRIQRLESR